MKAETSATLVSILRDLYLIVDEESIPVDELRKFLVATESPFKIVTWCILFLCGRLQNYTLLDAKELPLEDKDELRLMWELISKHAYSNIYRCIVNTEPGRVKNRFYRNNLDRPRLLDQGETCTIK